MKYDDAYVVLSDLISRLENAKEPSRKLDDELIRWFQYPLKNSHYTASIDDAINLIPEDIAWTITKNHVSIYADWNVWLHAKTKSKYPSLAVCAVALKYIKYVKYDQYKKITETYDPNCIDLNHERQPT